MEKREKINPETIEVLSDRIFNLLNGKRFTIVAIEWEQAVCIPRANPSQNLLSIEENGNRSVCVEYYEQDNIYANLIVATSAGAFSFSIFKNNINKSPSISFSEKYFTIYFKDNHGKEVFIIFSPEEFDRLEEYNIVLSTLSDMHNKNSKDPIELSCASFSSFRVDCITQCRKLQDKLIEIAKDNNLPWVTNLTCSINKEV